MSIERKPPETPGEHLAEFIGIFLGIVIGIPVVGFAIVTGGWLLVQLIDLVFLP